MVRKVSGQAIELVMAIRVFSNYSDSCFSLSVVIDACELHQLLLQWFCANSVLQNLSPAKGRTNITWAIEGIRKEICPLHPQK